jgi:hypothetical protein
MKLLYIILFVLLINVSSSVAQDEIRKVKSSKDTAYEYLANEKILNMLKTGKAPVVTLQLRINYDIGHLDLAGVENTYFSKSDFESGANFGTRYGYGFELTGKIALHKAGNVRLNVTAGYNRFSSSFVVASSPEGKVNYNVYSAALGVENNFSPARKVKPFVGLDFITSFISGDAMLATDSADFNLKIKNGTRFAGICTVSPVLGFRPSRGFRLRIRKLPKPRNSTLSPSLSASVIQVSIMLTTASVCFVVS